MAIQGVHSDSQFGVGDVVRVHQKIQESGKSRIQVFEGMVIGIKGRNENKSFTVRRIGVQKIGIEQIFPLSAPTLEKIEVKRKGVQGVRHAKLYFTRNQSKHEIEKIYSRVAQKKA